MALHRRAAQAAELSALGATPVSGDLSTLAVQELATQMAGSEVVVFSAGAGGSTLPCNASAR